MKTATVLTPKKAPIPSGASFQSPRTIEQETGDNRILNTDIYGFMTVRQDSRPLDDILDGVRSDLAAVLGAVTELGALTERPAHDDLPAAPTTMAQRQLQVTVSGSKVH